MSNAKQLRYYQQDAIDALYKYFETKSGNPLVSMATGCHAKGTEILMYDGTLKKVEDIKIDDKLMGDDSTPRKVLSLAYGKEMMYEITPIKGEPFVVNEGHIISLQRTNTGKISEYKKEKIINITVKDYLTKTKYWKHLYKLYRKPVLTFSPDTKTELPVSPYILGILLGDGCILTTVSICTPDKEIVDELKEFSKNNGLRLSCFPKKGSKASSYNLCDPEAHCNKPNKIAEKLRDIKAWGVKCAEKFVPHSYKISSWKDRIEILSGLLDTDGHYDRGCYDYISKSKQLADDVVFIARSLGLYAKISECEKFCQTGNGGVYWRVCISGNLEILNLRIKRKQAASRLQKKNPLVTGFSIKPLTFDYYYGFALDGNHLYLTSDFIVHHNTGKALVLSAFCKKAIEDYPETNIIVCVAVKELIEQNYQELLGIWSDAPAGICSAGIGIKKFHHKITFAGIQTVWNKAYRFQHEVHLVIIDEVHGLGTEADSMYRKFLADLTVASPHLKVIGMTATPYRLSQGLLTEGKNALFTDIVYDYGILQGITDGYLSPLISKSMSTKFDLSDVGTRNGDYIVGQLERAVDQKEINKAIVDEIVEYGEDRKCWLVFCTTVDHAIHMRDEIRSRGYSCEMVCGETPKAERNDILRRYKAGEIRCVTNVNVMTTGTNIPQIDLIASARPSKSAGLVVQAAGRGTRICKDKDNCLLLDFSGWLEQHGPIDLIRAKKKGEKGEGVAPTKTCPKCKTIVFAGLKECSQCGFEFPPPDPKIERKASESAVLSTQLKIETYPVTGVSYYRHKKSGKPDTLRVEYQSGLVQTFNKWVCLEHSSTAREMACFWWRKNAGTSPPNSITEALARTGELKIPKEVSVKKIGKYFEVVGVNL